MSPLIEGLVFALVFGAIVASIVYGFIAAKKNRDAMNAYALAHGWSAFAANDMSAGMYVPRRIANEGIRHSYGLSYQLELQSHPAVVFEYTYVTESTETDAQGNTTTTESNTNFSILAFQLAGLTPIEIVKHSIFSKLTTLGQHLEHLKVEGDFNKHFDVFVADHGEVDALTILTPDTMALIEDNGQDFNIQIQGDWVVIYGNAKYINAKKIDVLVGYVTILLPELAQKLHQYAAAPAPVQPIAPVTVAPTIVPTTKP